MTSRRELLGVIGLTVGVAGCSSPFGAEEPEPIDADDTELAAIADIEVPSVPETPLVEVTDGHVTSQRERAEALLEPIPSDLATEIPNEAVRSYIDEERTDAREDLEEATESQANYVAATSLVSARRHAGTANGAYAAASGRRVREDVYEEIEPLQDRVSTVSERLERVGDSPHRVALAYDTVEEHLDRANPENRGVYQPAAASETDAVGDATGTLAYNRANLDIASHIADNRTGDRFDEQFERVASDLLSDLEGRPGDLPETADSIQWVGELLFDATMSETPRQPIAETLYFTSKTADEIRDELDDGRLATALLDLSRYEHTRRTVESTQEAVAEGSYDRPADAVAVRRVKERARDETESVLSAPRYPALVRKHVQRPLYLMENADQHLEEYSDIVQAVGEYALANELARTLPGAVYWTVEQLSS